MSDKGRSRVYKDLIISTIVDNQDKVRNTLSIKTL